MGHTGEREELAGLLASEFGDNMCMYVGGPEKLEEGATLVHGHGSLEGSVEIAPGTGIYTGGERAAIEAVRDGIHSPLDFRWFVGRHTALQPTDGAWQPAACSRALALKQCLGLPKPLWHEVMELIGGDYEMLSRLELIKREDLMTSTQAPNATGSVSLGSS